MEDRSNLERDVQKISQRVDASDAFLYEILQNSWNLVTDGVGIFANGMVFIGTIADPVAFAEFLDTRSSDLLAHTEQPEGISDEEWAEVRGRFATINTQAAERHKERREAAIREINEGEEGDDLSREAAEVLRFPPFITLRDVKVWAPSAQRMTALPFVRIASTQIVGWWPATRDVASSRLSWSLWNHEEPGDAPQPD